MIQSQEEFDACLEEVTALMESQPADGSPQSRRLSEAMGQLAAYTSFLETDDHSLDDEQAAERAELLARATELERQFRNTSGPHTYIDLHGEEGSPA